MPLPEPHDELTAEMHLRLFMRAVHEGRDPRPETLAWLAKAFGQIVDARADPRQALRLTGKRGRPTDLEIAVDVARLVVRDPKQRGAQTRAVDQVAKVLGKPEKADSIRRNYKRNEETAICIAFAERQIEVAEKAGFPYSPGTMIVGVERRPAQASRKPAGRPRRRKRTK